MCSKSKVVELLKDLRLLYPQAYKVEHDDEVALLKAYYKNLYDYTDEVVDMAVKEAISNAGHFAPTIGDILTAIKKLGTLSQPSESELWSQLNIACNKVVNRGDMQKIWESMHPILRAYCGSTSRLIALANIDLDSFETYERQKFSKTLPTLTEREERPMLDNKLNSLKEIMGA